MRRPRSEVIPGMSGGLPTRRRAVPLGRLLLGALLFVLAALAGAGVGGWLYRDDVALALVRRWIEARSLPMRVSGVRLDHWPTVELSGVGVLAGGLPIPGLSLRVPLVRVALAPEPLIHGRLVVRGVELLEPLVTLSAIPNLNRVRVLGRQGAGGDGSNGPGRMVGGLGAARVEITGGAVDIQPLGQQVRGLDLCLDSALAPSSASGRFHLDGPIRGACDLEASPKDGALEISLRCDPPMSFEQGGVTVEAGRLRLTPRRGQARSPGNDLSGAGGQVEIVGLVVRAPVPGDPSPKPRLAGDVRVRVGGAGLWLEGDMRAGPTGRVTFSGRVHPETGDVELGGEVTGIVVQDSPLPAMVPGELRQGALAGSFRLTYSDRGRQVSFDGDLDLRDVVYFHDALADDPVRLHDLTLALALRVDRSSGAFDAPEVKASVDRVVLHGGLSVRRPGPRVRADLSLEPISTKDLSASIPLGLRGPLRFRRPRGRISLDAHIDLPMDRPEELRLTISPVLDRVDVDLGRGVDLELLEGPFVRVWEDEEREEVYRFETGPGTDPWVSLDELPPILPIAVIAQEDGGFYKHHGFSMYHIKGSIVRNLKEGRFARGASTITMQLARNLFLSRRKTLARKLQEVVVTWALERALDKDRILELYLNVIEWGPGIFGLKAAARYYFDKAPAELTTRECLFLSTAIPRPRLVYQAFARGRLNRTHRHRIERMLALLHRRGHLDDREYERATEEELHLAEPMDALRLPNLWRRYRRRLVGHHRILPVPEEPEEEEDPDTYVE